MDSPSTSNSPRTYHKAAVIAAALVAVLVVTLTATLVAPASAQEPPGPRPEGVEQTVRADGEVPGPRAGRDGDRRDRERRGARELVTTTAQELEMQPRELVRAMADGATPAQVADGRGVSRDALVAALVERAMAHIEQAASNRPGLDVERAVTRATARIEAWVDNGPPRRR